MIKRLVLKALSNISWINTYFSGVGVIFMLHRVAPIDENKLMPNENMKISPQFLENLINILIKKRVKFVSLNELYYILVTGQKPNSYMVAFTLDDGYKDNYYIAYPIFKKYNIPFTIYISPSLVDKKSPLWWYVLEDVILENEQIEIYNGVRYRLETKQQKEKAFLEIRRMILNNLSENFLDTLNNIFKHYKVDWFYKNEGLCMSWDEIKELSKDNLCTIGNHTLNHLPLTNLREDIIKKEIIIANEILEDKIKKIIEHFAYPFGGKEEVKNREFEVVKNFNFKTAVTTRRGAIYHQHRKFLNCCLPRIMITENFKIEDIGKPRRKRIVTE